MSKCGLKCIGVDPAKNIVDIAQANGLPVEYGYWPEYSKNIKHSFDAIVAMNVLAHVDDPLNFLIACASKLSFDGIILVQNGKITMKKKQILHGNHLQVVKTCIQFTP